MSETGSTKGWIIGVVIGTLVAGGGGFALGLFGMPRAGAPAETAPPKAKAAEPGEVKPLVPIVTNLREPSSLYVRLEAAVVLEPGASDGGALAAKIGDDLVSYLRTVSLSEIEGPTGFQYLKEDLRKHAIQLGGGKVKDLYVQTFVVE